MAANLELPKWVDSLFLGMHLAMISNTARPYDRTRDVSKLIGCDVRNVNYRWEIYIRHLETLAASSQVLDFGAGSLRESFDIAKHGFVVTAVDLDHVRMESFASDYDWEGIGKPRMLNALPDEGQFDLITAFDIIEHLEKPDEALTHIRRLLRPHGLMFVTVPNKWTVREFATKLRGPKGLPPGQAHIQFKSPLQWRRVFRDCGFEILDHDMAIGPIVNTTEFLAYQLKLSRLHRAIAKFLARMDNPLKPFTKGLYGWNLFVLRAAANK